MKVNVGQSKGVGKVAVGWVITERAQAGINGGVLAWHATAVQGRDGGVLCRAK
jgi:hypothetical protein